MSGIVTFKNATVGRDVCGAGSDERLLIETDSPYLRRCPTGQDQRAGVVVHVAAAVATLRGVAVEAVAALTTANYHRCRCPLTATGICNP